jgi:PAS domain S-box-containing protein
MGNKTKEQLIEEIESLRQEVAELRQEKAEHKRMEEVLETYESMVESAHDAIFFKDLDSRYVMANAKTIEVFGLSREEVIGNNDHELMTNQEEAKKNIEDDQLVFKTKKPTEVTKHMTGADGKEYWFRAIKVPQFDRKGNIIGLVGIARDITERKRAEEELEESKELYRALVEAGANIGEGIILSQNTDKVEAAHLFANQEWVQMTGYSVEELREISYLALIHPRHRDAVANRVRRRFQGELLPGPWEVSIIAKDGTELPVEATATPITYQGRPAVVAYIRDISERKRAEEKLKASLEEKEVLLKEIHHRVKNNLQVISSLLKLQSGYIEEERYAGMFKESQDRVKSMALVHEKLYQSEDLARIDFAGYIESVVQELRRSYGSERAGIGIKTEVENIKLGVDYAIPCGLMVNELVSNCLKHAFPGGKRGEVRIAMRQVGRDGIELEVSDNGAGLPGSVEVRNAKSLGLRLVSILAEDQLRGEMELDRTKGTKVRIKFRVGE